MSKKNLSVSLLMTGLLLSALFGCGNGVNSELLLEGEEEPGTQEEVGAGSDTYRMSSMMTLHRMSFMMMTLHKIPLMTVALRRKMTITVIPCLQEAEAVMMLVSVVPASFLQDRLMRLAVSLLTVFNSQQ